MAWEPTRLLHSEPNSFQHPRLFPTASEMLIPENLESPGKYRPGGYHPVSISDQLHNGRYQILHSLGHGSFSTVWLAYNLHYGSNISSAPGIMTPPHSRYVAVKILISGATEAKCESKVLWRLQVQARTSGLIPPLAADRIWSIFRTSTENETVEGSEFIVSLLDEFEIRGPNGLHHCTVTNVLGPDIAMVNRCTEIKANPLPLAIGKQAVVQCAKVLMFLHSRGVVHGDPHTKNIAFSLPDIDTSNVEEVYAAFGEPVKLPFSYVCDELEIPLIYNANQPEYLIPPPSTAVLWDLCTRDRLPNIRILDFTESFRIPCAHFQPLPGTPMPVAAPELLMRFDLDISTAIDIWSFACTAYRIFADFELLLAPCNTLTEHLADSMFVSGGKKNVPERFWRELWERYGGKEWGEINGEELEISMESFPDLNQRIREMRGRRATALDVYDAAVVRRLLEAAMEVEPKERCSANDIVHILENWDHMAADNKLRTANSGADCADLLKRAERI